MNALTCEMCGSTNLIKSDGVFVCQHCGTKYSVEEARKMMVEGTVSVKGTVVVDKTASLDNYLMMAINATQAGNYEEAESYCNKVIEINPNHSRAWQLKGTAAGWQSTLANLRIFESMKAYDNALEFATEDEKETVKSYIAKDASELSLAIIRLSCNHFREFPQNDTHHTVDENWGWIITGMSRIVESCGGNREEIIQSAAAIIGNAAIDTYDRLRTKYVNESHPSEYEWKDYREGGDSCLWLLRTVVLNSEVSMEDKTIYYKKMIKMQEEIVKSCSWTYSNGGYVVEYTLTDEAKTYRIDEIMEWHNNLKELHPEYEIPSRPSASSSGGCYIATAVYGSYDCPEVWTLRRFRDYTLAESTIGRMFIKAYYTTSPTLVKWFGNSAIFKTVWRTPLDKLVKTLNEKGVLNSPYKDRVW